MSAAHTRLLRSALALSLATYSVSAAEKASEKVSSFYGSLSDAISIDVPGFRGLEPKLALSYSSEGRNGFVGVGWSLSGVSIVERTNAGGGTPRFDATDGYRLDGQELVPCQAGSVSPSCTSGGTHATKVESYLKIRFDAGANSWTVWGRDGTRTVFLAILDVPAGPHVPGGTLRWGQASATDTDNNVINTTWLCVDGDCYPSALSYNGYQITFYRESRPDPLSFAAASILGQTRYRLRSVIVSLGATPIRGYKLAYSTSSVTGRSLLASMQQFGKDLVQDGAGLISAGTALPAQSFTYQNDSLAKRFQDWAAPPTPPTTVEALTWANIANVAVSGTGNSITKASGAQGTWDAGATSTRAISSGNGYLEFTASESSGGYKVVGLSNGNTDASETDIDFGLWESAGGQLYVMENGTAYGPYARADGDLLRVAVSAGVVRYTRNGQLLRQSTRTPTFPLQVDSSIRTIGSSIQNVFLSGALVYVNAWCQGTFFLSGDFNGDGRTDQLCHSYATNGGLPTNHKVQVSLATANGFATPVIWLANVGLGRPTTGDFNSDGKADLADHDYSIGDVRVALSTGSGFGSMTVWGNASAIGPGGATACRVSPAFFGTGDFNGDGIADVYCKRVDAGDILIGLSNGSSTFSFSVFGNYGCDAYDYSVGAIDFDGDAKDDWFCIGANNNSLLVFPSTGNQFLYPAHGYINFCSATYYVLGDLNGDGRTDTSCTATGKVALSTGRGFLEQGTYGTWCLGQARVFAADVDGDGASELVCNADGNGADDILVRKWRDSALAPAETWKGNWCTGGVRSGDYNGDGRTDLYCDSAAAPALAGTAGLQSDLLEQMANGLGGTTQVSYTTSTSFTNTNNPPPKYVVNSATVSDGRGVSSTTSYTFSGGLMDRQERRFLGFRYARRTLPCLSGETACPYVETWFKQDLASAGKPEQILRRSGPTSILARGDFEYTTNGMTIPRTSLLTREETFSYDGAGCPAAPCSQEKKTRVTHQHDAYGNRTRTDLYGDADSSGDETYTVWTFRPNTSAYIVDRPALVEQFGPTGTKLTSKQLHYDGQTTWNLPPIKGAVTAERNWLDRENRYVERPMLYDTWGNLREERDESGRPVTTTYDPTYHIFPESLTNGANETERMVWDPVCGQPRELRDANNQLTAVQFDALCRPTRTDAPLGAFEIRRYLDLGNPNLQRIKVEIPSALGPEPETQWSEAYLDGLGRTYLTVTESPTPGGVRQETAYNTRGGVASVTAPRYSGAPAYTTRYSYDQLDRVTEVRYPDDHTIGKSYGLWSETTTDENARATTVRFDAYGRSVATERLHNGGLLQTFSTYDLLGRLTGLTDPLEIQWTWHFDSLGRNYSRTDPDAGTWTYEFDDAGRPRAQIDAMSQRTDFGYDLAGRLATRTVYVGGQAVETVVFTRSEFRGAQFFNVGRVTTVSGPGTTVLKTDHDTLGRPVKEVRTLDGTDYAVEKRYDSASRLRGITYPDLDAIGTPSNPITYDAAGQLKTIPGILNDVLYDAAGRSIQQTNANGTVTSRTYSPHRGFLETIVTRNGGGEIQNLGYTLDPTGRAGQVRSGFPNESWEYGYDDLYRLTSATPDDPGGTQTFEYDAIGRMTFNSRIGTYSYPPAGASRPHAPSDVAGDIYGYDANGNVVQGGGRSFDWTVSNQPSRVNQTYFTYGAFGERLKKTTAGAATSLYPFGDDYEITNGVLTKYVSVGGLGVVAKKVAAQLYWHHTDRLGSIQAVTRNTGAVVQRRTYRPYGERIEDTTTHVEPRGYIDQRTDDETGLTYLHARYYDPAVTIFLSPDPIQASLHAYGYSSGDPINRFDPSGLADEPDNDRTSEDNEQNCKTRPEQCIQIIVPMPDKNNRIIPGIGGGAISPFVIRDLLRRGGGGSQPGGGGTPPGQPVLRPPLGLPNFPDGIQLPGPFEPAPPAEVYDPFQGDPMEALERVLRSGSVKEKAVALGEFFLRSINEGGVPFMGVGPVGGVGTFAKGAGALYPRGPGASFGPVPKGHVNVSRWISAEEARLWMRNGGTSIPGGVGQGRRVYVTAPGMPRPGHTGPYRVDFAVPGNALQVGGRAGWYYVLQPLQNTPIHNVIIYVP